MPVSEIMNVITDVSARSELALMRRHQEWVKMHCDMSLDPQSSEAVARFLAMVQGLLTEDKFSMFKSLMRWPLPSNDLTAVIFDRLSRIFEGRNPVFSYQFTNSGMADDWEWYRNEVLHEKETWRGKGWQYFRTEPNSVLVVDMPERRDDSDKYPQPYFYWVTVQDIIGYGKDPDGSLAWFAWKNDDTRRVYYVDKSTYRSYPYGTDTWHNPTDAQDAVENPHNLGYCPAKFFIDEPISLSHPDVKKSPVTKALSSLDWFVFVNTSKKHLDTYGAYPIYSGVEAFCNYETELDGQHLHCDHGIICDEANKPFAAADGRPMKCPKCGGHRIVGAGTYVEYPAPDEQEGVPDMREPIQILSVDRASLDYNTNEEERLRKNIIATCVGIDSDMISDFSVSDAQINANYESQGTILIRVKREFENAQRFVDSTMIALRYGKEALESITVNYGTEFYTLTTEQLRKRYKEAKASGASESDLAGLRRQITETEYRNNPTEQQRMLILLDVEPLSGMSVNEAINRWNMGLVDDRDMRVKANFGELVRRFERENGNIIFFSESRPYREKIEIIKQTLRDYVTNFEPRKNDPAGVQRVAPGGGQGGAEE